MQTVIKRKPIKRAAVLHDLCTVGKAAMTNILPVLSVLGVEACPVPTMVLSTHTGGYGKPAVYPLSGFAGDCGKHLKEQGFSFDAVFVGYLGNEKNVREAYAFLDDFSSGPILFDPIMADHGKFYSNFDESYNALLKGLIPRCTLMTPNYTESCLLTGEPYEEICTEDKLHKIALKLKKLGCKNAVITSIPLEGRLSAVGILTEDRTEWFTYEPTGRAYPGTGDLFSAVLLGALLKDLPLEKAAGAAHRFVAHCIQKSDEAGYDTREGVLLEPELLELVKIVS